MNLEENSFKQSNTKKYREDEVFFLIGIIILIPLMLSGIWFEQIGYLKYANLLSCAFKRACGLPCPGCGGTRALFYLLQGDIAGSLRMNPSVLYGFLAYLHFMLLYLYRKYIAKTIIKKKVQIQYYMYGAIIIILSQWIVKLLVIFS